MQNFAIVRRGVQEEIGHRQNKQTLKYLVDREATAAQLLLRPLAADRTGRCDKCDWGRGKVDVTGYTVNENVKISFSACLA